MSEFDLIQKYFTRPTRYTDLGVGDDAALIPVSAGMQLAISTDMLVAGTHFFHDAAPYDIGWKALAVNVSDMAAMGANPKWATLAIALPSVAAPSLPSPLPSPTRGEGVLSSKIDAPLLTTINNERELKAAPNTPSPLMGEGWGEGWGEGATQQTSAITETWLSEFSRGFFACADEFNIDLIGGDTTRGPLNISVTIMGEVPIGKAFRRDGAQVGDDIWVSGQLGSAALGLAHLQGKIILKNELDICLKALNTPTPRVALGLALRGISTSCIDISDGLLADLGHILKACNLGATLDLEEIPCIELLKNSLEKPQFQEFLLAGGDDYELCFTAPPSQRSRIEMLAKQQNILLTCIANTHKPTDRIDTGLQAIYRNNKITLLKQGFDHFG